MPVFAAKSLFSRDIIDFAVEDYAMEGQDERSLKVFDWIRFVTPRILALFVVVGSLTRILFGVLAPTEIEVSVIEWLRLVGIGIVNDIAFGVMSLAPAMLVYIFLNDHKYKNIPGFALMAVLGAATLYAFYPQNALSPLFPWVNTIVRISLSVIFIVFAVKFFLPQLRSPLKVLALSTVEFLYVLFAISGIVIECVFFAKFGVRYNYFAVDYLVNAGYTLKEMAASVPLFPICVGLVLVSAFIAWKIFRLHDVSQSGNINLSNAFFTLVLYGILFGACVFWLRFSHDKLASDDSFVTEAQANGVWNWVEASRKGIIHYDDFYETIPAREASALKDSLTGEISIYDEPEIRKNIVLLTLENISYGNLGTDMPFLASLKDKGLYFTNLYTTGMSVTDGIEALALCAPPIPGKGVMRRKGLSGLPTAGKALQTNGYSTTFIYGGIGRDSNLKGFFTCNGYEFIDLKGLGEISFKNAMGACDDDVYAEVIRQCDRKAEIGKPFHIQSLTVSNHRPYSFPGGSIILNDEEGAVDYSDDALARFFSEAEPKPWFKNTVFVITSAKPAPANLEGGIPLPAFHVPAVIYSPGFVAPGKAEKICSLIDIMPSVLSMLRIRHGEDLYGMDALSDHFSERAFVANHQKLGYYKDGVLTTLLPLKEVKAYEVTDNGKQIERGSPQHSLTREAEAIYQSVSDSYPEN